MAYNTVFHGSKKISRGILALFLATAIVWLYVYSYSMETLFGFSQPLVKGIKSSNVLNYLINERNITHSYPIIQNEVSDLQILDYDRKNIKYIYPEVIDSIYDNTDVESVDWSRYAYVLYATSSSHMCNAMMIFAELRKFNTRAQLVLLVRKEFITEPEKFKYEYDSLTTFSREYNVLLTPTEVIQGDNAGSIWVSSYTKLLVFNQTQYDRIIYMDTDAILLHKNLDELFFIPHCSMAVSTAYWLTKIRFTDNFEPLKEKYPAQKYGFKPLTTAQRAEKVGRFIDKNINEFKNEKGYLPHSLTGASSHGDPKKQLKAEVNEKNFYTNLYNELPNYPMLDEFALTNIVMVIEPNDEVFKRVQKSIREKNEGEFDMDLVQNHVFPFNKVLERQGKKSLVNSPHLTFSQRLDERPEFLILPHQVYGTITPELNSETDHTSYYADAPEQLFATYGLKNADGEPAYYDVNDMESVGDHLYQKIRYLHFSDAPIPKPWFDQIREKEYMGFRTRCKSHDDFHNEDAKIVKPKYLTKDCSSGRNWENAHKLFKETRKQVCGMDLIKTEEDTYYYIIN